MQNDPYPESNVGVFIHELSIRYADQVVPLEALDLDEVLAESELKLSGSISGKIPDGTRVVLKQKYRPFFRKTEKNKLLESVSRGRFRTDLNLHNGANDLEIQIISPDEAILDSKEFVLHYKGTFREYNETIFIAFFLAILIRSVVLQAFWIPTGSMEPTLLGEKKNGFTMKKERDGDRILVNRFAYVIDLSLDGRIPWGPRVWLNMPKRGDIIVFKYPGTSFFNDEFVSEEAREAARKSRLKAINEPKDYIKRCIGLPGDHILVSNGDVYVNQVKLDEPYIAEPPYTDFEAVVPDGHIFVMGDNRNNSADSRYWGPMPLTHLKGQAVFAYLPFNRIHPIRSFPHTKLEQGAVGKYPGMQN